MASLSNPFDDPSHWPLAEIKALKDLDKKGRRHVKIVENAQQEIETFAAALDCAVHEFIVQRAITGGIGKGAADAEFGVDRDADLGWRHSARVGFFI